MFWEILILTSFLYSVTKWQVSSHHNIYNACTESLHNNSTLYTGKRTKEEKEKCNISTGFMCCSRNEMNTKLSGLSKTYLGSGKHSFQKMGYSLLSVRYKFNIKTKKEKSKMKVKMWKKKKKSKNSKHFQGNSSEENNQIQVPVSGLQHIQTDLVWQ